MIQIWSDRGPQGYRYRVWGKPARDLVDFEGIALVRVSPKEKTKRTKTETVPDSA
jgi:hypothetical protein